eukprot:scpid28637/ scgid9111/ 
MSRGSFHVALPHHGSPMKAVHSRPPSSSSVGISRPTLQLGNNTTTNNRPSSGSLTTTPVSVNVHSRHTNGHASNGGGGAGGGRGGASGGQDLSSQPQALMRASCEAQGQQRAASPKENARDQQVFVLRDKPPATPSKHSSSTCPLHLQSVQKVASGNIATLSGSSSRQAAHIFHFTLDWKKMCQHRDRHHQWCKVKSTMFGYGGQLWCIRGHISNNVKDPSFLIIYPSCLLDCKEKRKRKKSSEQQSPSKSMGHDSRGEDRRKRFSSSDGESRYRCSMMYKLSLLCSSDASSGRNASGQSLTVTTDDEGVIFDAGKPLNPLQLVIPVGLLSSKAVDSSQSQYVMDDMLHFRLVCWPVRSIFSCSVSVMDLFPWDGSSQLRRFDHVCWESEVFLFCQAWWRLVMFPKGHGTGCAQRMTVFLELVDLASTRKMPAPEMPLLVHGSLIIEQHRSAAAMMVTAGHDNIVRSTHGIRHRFDVGELCGCRGALLLQAEVTSVTLKFESRSGQLQGAWCQPNETASSFNGSPEMWAWYMQNHQSRWLRPGSRSLSARSSLNNLSSSLDPHQLTHRFSQLSPSPLSPGILSARSFADSPGFENGYGTSESVESIDVIHPLQEHRSVSELTKEFKLSCSLPQDDGEASV